MEEDIRKGGGKEVKKSKLAQNKIFGAAAVLLGVFGFLVIIHRLSCYVFEYDAQYSPVDYGRFNVLSFFTIQSNVFVYIYLIAAGLAAFGVKGAEKIAYEPLVGAMATTYIVVTGVVYTAGIPMGFTPPFEWYDAYHAMNSFIQVYFHMIVPPLMLVLWFFPFTDKRIKHSSVWYFAIYPLVYSVFSIIRGALGKMHFYPYPFYRPEFIWSLFSSDTVNYAAAYALMAFVLAAGLMLFVGIGRAIVLVNDRMISVFFAPDRSIVPEMSSAGTEYSEDILTEADEE